MQFAGRTGGVKTDVDLDNLNVTFTGGGGVGTLPAPDATMEQNFDDSPVNYTLSQFGTAPEASIDAGGPTGNFLRLTEATGGQNNAIAFDRPATGAYRWIKADFDFRVGPRGAADGFAFGLLNTSVYGPSGAGPAFTEEPNIQGSIGVGFDIYPNAGEPSDHHLSVYFNGTKIGVDITPPFDFVDGLTNHATILVKFVEGGAIVAVYITLEGGSTTMVNQGVFVAGALPYESRPAFAARTGGVNTNHDFDNVVVNYYTPIDYEAESMPIALTGWNGDIVSEVDTNTRFSETFTNDDAWFESGVDGHLDGFPSGPFLSRALNSSTGDHTLFEFQPFTGANALVLGDGRPESGTLTLTEPSWQGSISVLATSAGGGGTSTFTLNYTDGSSSEPLLYAAYDWNTNGRPAEAVALGNLGRNQGIGDGTGFSYGSNVPFGLYETVINTSAIIPEGALIESITFEKPAAGATAIFAISGTGGTAPPLPTVTPIKMWNWNADVVSEVDTATRYSDGVGGKEGWFEAGVDGHLDGLPATPFSSLAINTVTGDNSRFQIEPFTGPNSLRVGTGGDGAVYANPGELTLDNPGRYSSIAVISTAGWGGGVALLELNFEDGTISSAVQYDTSDWWIPNGATPSTVIVIGRNNDRGVDGTGFVYDGGGNRTFGLFEADIDLVAMGLDDKVLTSITFYASDKAAATMNIMAVSGARLPDIPKGTMTLDQGANAVLKVAGSPNSDEITITIDPAAPDGGLDVLVESNDTDVVSVSPVHIDAGETVITSIVAAIGPGTAEVSISAAGYDPAGPISYTVELDSVPGDVNSDGCVNVADLLTVRNNLGNTGSDIFPPAADVSPFGDPDGVVNVADLLYVRNRLGDGEGCL